MSPRSSIGTMRAKGTGSVYRLHGGKWAWSPPQAKRRSSRGHGPYDFRHQAERELSQWLEEHKEMI